MHVNNIEIELCRSFSLFNEIFISISTCSTTFGVNGDDLASTRGLQLVLGLGEYRSDRSDSEPRSRAVYIRRHTSCGPYVTRPYNDCVSVTSIRSLVTK